MRLIIVRHGESHVNVASWETLHTLDTELTPTGHQQATQLRNWLWKHGAKTDALYCSTMIRARQTAHYLSEAFNLAPTFDDRLREIGTTYATGLPIEEALLPRSFANRYADEAPFIPRSIEVENVESWMHFRIRLAVFIDDLIVKHLDQTVYVVAHGGVIAGMIDNVFNVGPYRRCSTLIDNTGWTEFGFKPNAGREPWTLRAHNRTDHLG
ncbi:MAG: histidine phosphatase family protein [Anaerolineae bacterium]|nr:histidine phosphatase family protein [Anaerolineae bacterium]